jgi:SPP1 gp7 family putative phage head morphogenesis protein
MIQFKVKLTRNAKGKKKGPADPTRTFALRKGMLIEIRRRFSALKARIRKFIVDEDAFALNGVIVVNYNPNHDELGRFTDDKFSMGELHNGGLTGDRLRNLMHPDNPRRASLLKTLAGLWSNDDTNAKLRKTMSDLASMTTAGGLLEHIHPGEGTYYRGGETHGVRATASSHTRDKTYAKMYGDLSTTTISKDTPAVDLDKMHGTGKPIYKEVLIDTRKAVRNAFCPTGEGGGVDATCSPKQGFPTKVAVKIKGAFTKFTDRYGRAGAVAMFVACAATMPLPGNILMVIGVAEATRFVGKKLLRNDARLDDLHEFAVDLAHDLGIDPPSMDELSAALETRNANPNHGPDGRFSSGPVELGSLPIPEGHIRLYHYTKGAPQEVREQGLLHSKARGHTYGEPDMVWGSTQPPDPNIHNIAEFHVPANDEAISMNAEKPYGDLTEWMKGNHHVGLTRDVKPDELLAVHEPWHQRYHYANSNPDVKEAILAGEHDDLLANPEYGPAIRHIQQEATRNVFCPGSNTDSSCSKPEHKQVEVRGVLVDVVKDPDKAGLNNWLRKSTDQLRGLVGGGHLYVWEPTVDGVEVYHEDIAWSQGLQDVTSFKDHVAVSKSQYSGEPIISTYAGPDTAKSAVKWAEKHGFTYNTFCPTGPGGGVDATCSPMKSHMLDVHGERVEVVENPTIEGLSNYLTAVKQAYRPPPGVQYTSGLKMLEADGKLYVWDASQAHHTEVSRRLDLPAGAASSSHCGFIDKIVDGKPVLETYSGVEASPGLTAWGKKFGLTVNTFCPTGPGGGVDATCGKGVEKFAVRGYLVELHKDPTAEGLSNWLKHESALKGIMHDGHAYIFATQGDEDNEGVGHEDVYRHMTGQRYAKELFSKSFIVEKGADGKPELHTYENEMPAYKGLPSQVPKAMSDWAATRGLVANSLAIDAAAFKARQPTDAQKHAGNYRKGHIKIHGLDVTIETPMGAIRHGKLHHHYGYIRRTVGADGDQVDCFLGPYPESPRIYVVDQEDREGNFDEHKVMLGFLNEAQARDAYGRNYPWPAKNVTEFTVPGFKAWLRHDDTTVAINAFCPTGEGGGVDPSCSPSVAKVEVDGDLVEVHKDPSEVGLKRWLNTLGPYDAQQLGLRGIVSDNHLYAWEWGDGGKADHAAVTGKLGVEDSFENHVAITLQRGRVVLATYMGKEEAPDVVTYGRRHKLAVNAFCPTGPGGGVDATCGKSGPSKHPYYLKVKGPKFIVDEYGLPPVSDDPAPGGKYYYHGTPPKNLAEISKSGLKDMSRYGAGVSVSPHLESQHTWGEMAGRGEAPAVLRFSQKQYGRHEDHSMDEGRVAYTPHEPTAEVRLSGTTVKPEHIEVYRGGRWSPLVATQNIRDYEFSTDPAKIAQFKKWLKAHVDGYVHGDDEKTLWKKYIDQGYKKGAGRAFDDTHAAKRIASVADKAGTAVYAGSREMFLKSSFGAPETAEKVQLLVGRTFDELEGITTDMSVRMGRILADGLTQGQHPMEMAEDLMEQVDMTERRAETIARTEIIRAHAEGQLDAFDRLGVAEVGVEVEWATAGDDKVCEECASLGGDIYTIDDAHGMIPAHPNCRCAFKPVVPSFAANAAQNEWTALQTIRCETS